jgi:hypothetical protein
LSYALIRSTNRDANQKVDQKKKNSTTKKGCRQDWKGFAFFERNFCSNQQILFHRADQKNGRPSVTEGTTKKNVHALTFPGGRFSVFFVRN